MACKTRGKETHHNRDTVKESLILYHAAFLLHKGMEGGRGEHEMKQVHSHENTVHGVFMNSKASGAVRGDSISVLEN